MVVRHYRSVLMACCALFALSHAASSFAQTAQTEAGATPLQQITAKSGKKGRIGVADTPLATTVTAEKIAEKQVTDLNDLGRSVDAGINFSRGDAGVNLRGLSGPRITTTIDDIPIPFLSNSSRQGAFASINANGGGDAFDFSSVSALDVVRGADSSKGGSGMLGGGLVLRTLEPEDLIKEGRDWGAIVKSTYDSEENSISGSFAGAQRFDNTSVLFQGGLRKGNERKNNGSVDTYGRTRTEANPADLDQNNLLFKLRQDLENGHRIGFTGERFQRDLDIDLRAEQGLGRTYAIGNYDGFENRRRDRISIDYEYEATSDDTLFDTARATIYWQDLVRSSGSNGRTAANVRYGRDNEISNESFGLRSTAKSDFEYGGLNHSVTVGIDAARSSWSQYTFALCPTPATCPALNNQSEIPDVDSTTLGLTLEDRITLGDSPFAVTPGLRFDWFNYAPSANAGFQANPALGVFGPLEDRHGARLSPKILTTYNLTPDVELFAQLAMAYRAPTVDELYSRFYNAGGNYAQLGNPGLKPETGYGIELGMNFNDGSVSGRVAAFHNTYQNFIQTVTTTNPNTGIMEFNYTNVNSVMISGLEANILKEFDNGFHVSGSFAYAYGRNNDTNQRERSVAPFKAIIGAGYSQETFGVDVSMTASAAMLSDTVATTFDAPGYGVVDLSGWWTPVQFPTLKVQAGVYNVFDKTHFNALGVRDVNLAAASSQPRDYYSEPGRTFKVSITKTF